MLWEASQRKAFWDLLLWQPPQACQLESQHSSRFSVPDRRRRRGATLACLDYVRSLFAQRKTYWNLYSDDCILFYMLSDLFYLFVLFNLILLWDFIFHLEPSENLLVLPSWICFVYYI